MTKVLFLMAKSWQKNNWCLILHLHMRVEAYYFKSVHLSTNFNLAFNFWPHKVMFITGMSIPWVRWNQHYHLDRAGMVFHENLAFNAKLICHIPGDSCNLMCCLSLNCDLLWTRAKLWLVLQLVHSVGSAILPRSISLVTVLWHT